LRDQLAEDKLLGDQPVFATAYVKEVREKRESKKKCTLALVNPALNPLFSLFCFCISHRCSTSTCPAAS
jgi:hypothetical protein